MSQIGSRGEKICSGQGFLYNSAMTLNLDLETWFKDYSHPLLKGTLWVKYEPDLAKGKEYMLWKDKIGN
mgnify:CR=1 FL=1